MAVSQEFIRQVSEALQSLSNSLENSDGYPRGAELIINKADMDNTIAVPGVKYNSNPAVNENAVAQAYVQIPWSILSQVLGDMETATEAATEAAGSVDEAIQGANDAADNANAMASLANTAASNADASRLQIESNEDTRQSNEATRQDNEDTRQSNETNRQTNESGRVGAENARVTAETGRANAETARATAETAREQQATSDHNRAESDHDAIESSLTAAGNVNAELNGMTVTITDREGEERSVNIGFEIYATYVSKAAMNGDAANVPEGKFVMIATTDPTSADNATLWSRNSSPAGSTTPFSFLSDLDQASSAAWADWLNNMKPQIESATTAANTAATTANTAAGNADASRRQIESNETTRQSNEATRQGNETTRQSNETTRQSNETTRQSNETNRETAESGRVTAESGRVDAESGRATAESGRVDAETARANAESGRETAETAREQQASNDHQQAVSDSTQAGQDHDRAESDHSAAVTATNNANTQAGYAENIADHPPYIADGTAQHPGDVGHVYQWDYAHQIYVKGIQLSIDWETMSQAEKDALAQAVLDSIAFDEVPTEDSGNAVTSGGLYTIITALDDRLKEVEKVASQETINDLISEVV